MKIPVKILVLDLLIILFCIPGILQVKNKSALPFQITAGENKLVITNNHPPFNKNDILTAVDNFPVENSDQLEFLMDLKNPGDTIAVTVLRSGAQFNFNTAADYYYNNSYLAAVIFIGSLFIILGIVVLIKGTEKKASAVFHWASVSTAVILFCTWGNVHILPYDLGYLARYFFHAGYSFVGALFIHFALLFPARRNSEGKYLIYSFYTAALILTFWLSITFTNAADGGSLRSLELYLNAFNMLRVFVISGVIISVLLFARSLYREKSTSGVKKLKWIMYGFIAGPVLYILTWVLPQALNFTVLPEIIVLFFMLAVPATFAISILKYHLFDIDIVINRTIVYFLSIALLVLTYSMTVYLISEQFITAGNNMPSIISVMLVAILFQPLKTRVQKFVDLKFFRVQYDFKNTVNKFFSDLHKSSDFQSVMEYVVNETDKIIPLKESGIFLFDSDSELITKFYYKGFPFLGQQSGLYIFQKYFILLNGPVGYQNKIEGGVDILPADPYIFKQFGIAIIIPFFNETGKISGCFLAGEKKSEQRFSKEDIELLKMVAGRSSLEINRIRLNQDLIYEQMQTEKLQELDKLKSFFISSTAHELKTPLTSIRMFSEMIQNYPEKEKSKYLDIIKGECDRLSRLIDNLLDISRIEQNEKKYNINETAVIPLVRKSLLLMEFQFNIENCRVEFFPCEEEVFFMADEDAVIGALINIYSNALKYSRAPKSIKVMITCDEISVYISVTDNGIGISEQDIKNILQPYYRSTLVKNKDFIGTGIGLALVKHAVEGHNSKIEIISKIDEGSTFTLIFPRLNELNMIDEKKYIHSHGQ
jgi:signal transduction histidine kinase